MPGRASESATTALVPFVPEVKEQLVYRLSHGVQTPASSLSISWSRGNSLRVAIFRQPSLESSEEMAGNSGEGDVVELRMGVEDGEIDEVRKRRIAYGSAPAFALLQSRRNLVMASNSFGSSLHSDWWQHVLEYSRHIRDLLGNLKSSPVSVIEDPKALLKSSEKPTSSKAAWELMEFFYVDKLSLSWLPERLVDWLADYDSLLSGTDMTVHSKLASLQKKLVELQFIEDSKEYWEAIASALAVGWLDIVVKLLRLHGSYQLDQIDNREIENGLVEAIAVLVSTMPRMRPELRAGGLGQCFDTKPDFVKAWEKWRGQVAKLDCSAFWVKCDHRQTMDGLKNLLQIMLGNLDDLCAATYQWMELLTSHFLFIRPFTMGLEAMHSLAQKCILLKPTSDGNRLMDLLLGILGDNTEVVLAECSRTFGPWMVVHAIELLTAKSHQAEVVLHEQRYNLGGISIEELHRLVYAQVLSSHALTWQLAPIYLAACPKQGLGLLELLLYKQPMRHNRQILKNIEICRLYELGQIESSIMKIAGMHHWKHGRKGAGIYWLQRAGDEARLNEIAQQLFGLVGKSFSDESFRQWERLIELLGVEGENLGGLEFLHKYRDFKKSLQMIPDDVSIEPSNEKAVNAAVQAVDALILLMKSPSTPQRFWLPLLQDSMKLLNWRHRPLLNVSQTNLLLNKLQELSLARLRPDYCDSDLPHQVLSSIRLALAMNLGRAMIQE
ncbi:hypothetical protein AMTRI_Chr05g67170 [Amborella trichopoda]|uniref:Nuclear pore complex protein Nup85 n=1 Tax=Amborella trichopoda TaxID=13333 RepID=U5D126_AMBTC|nr:nuclear pore complex protein NUP85 [Amborella trichopoda]ERN15082.1 hypothetical protein AMTR_s00056p00051320 [Amborella trichopoda]|eukprot:XP_006853615.1 nuclear pore complex protein NUP85 [Amborella trichopoda]